MRPPIEAEVQALLKLDLAYHSTSPHNSPVVLVKKKDKTAWRMCVDYRILNSFTRPMYYPSKSIDEVLFKMANVDIMSALDLHNAYNQIPLTPRAGPISTFATHIGSYTLWRRSFGLNNAAFTLNVWTGYLETSGNIQITMSMTYLSHHPVYRPTYYT